METGSNPVFKMYGQIIPVIKKYDEALKQADFTQFNLIFQVARDSASFCIFNSENRKFMSVESVEFEGAEPFQNLSALIRSFSAEHQVLSRQFKSVQILYESNQSSLVPAPLFDEKEKESYSRFSFAGTDDHDILFDSIKNLDSYNLYLIPKVLKNTLAEIFPEHNLTSHSSILIESLLIMHRNSSDLKRIFINVRKFHLDIVIMDGRKLLYFNTFNYRSKEDFIYFVIFVMDQLKLNPEENELILSGFIDKNSKIFETIYKYVRIVSFQPRPNAFNYSYIFSDIPSHYYSNLFNFPLCES
jgi:hypothetical protein